MKINILNEIRLLLCTIFFNAILFIVPEKTDEEQLIINTIADMSVKQKKMMEEKWTTLKIKQ